MQYKDIYFEGDKEWEPGASKFQDGGESTFFGRLDIGYLYGNPPPYHHMIDATSLFVRINYCWCIYNFQQFPTPAFQITWPWLAQ